MLTGFIIGRAKQQLDRPRLRQWTKAFPGLLPVDALRASTQVHAGIIDNSARLGGSPMGFKVLVEDNFHYQDQSERLERGEFDSYEEAVAACKKIIDEYLQAAFRKGMGPEKLYASYVMFGEDPYVVPARGGEGFSARKYARGRCAEICRGD